MINSTEEMCLKQNFNFDREIAGINYAIEQIQNLSLLKITLKNNTNSDISLESAKIVRIAINNIKTKLNIDSRHTLSLEDNHKYTVCTEDISDVITKIWDAIVRTINYIWEKITNLFKSNKVTNKVKDIKIKALKQDLKNISTNRSTNVKTAIELPYIDAINVLKPFNYINSEWKPKEIISAIRQLQDKNEDIRECIFNIELTMKSFHAIYKHIASKDENVSNELIGNQDTINSANDNAINFFTSYVNGLKRDSSLNSGFRRVINSSLPDNGDNVNSASLKILKDFSHNGFIAFYSINGSRNSSFEMVVKDRIDADNEQVKIKMLSIDDLKTFTEIVCDTISKNITLAEDAEVKKRSIEKMKDEILNILSASIDKLKDTGNTDELKNKINYIKDTLLYINILSLKASQGLDLYTRTVDDYFKLNEFMIKYWKPDNN